MTKEPELDIGQEVYTVENDRDGYVESIHEGDCPRCEYDRITILGDSFAGVYSASCNACGFGHEI